MTHCAKREGRLIGYLDHGYHDPEQTTLATSPPLMLMALAHGDGIFAFSIGPRSSDVWIKFQQSFDVVV